MLKLIYNSQEVKLVTRHSLCIHSWYFGLRFPSFKRYCQAMQNSNHSGENLATVKKGLQDIGEFIYVEYWEYKIKYHHSISFIHNICNIY